MENRVKTQTDQTRTLFTKFPIHDGSIYGTSIGNTENNERPNARNEAITRRKQTITRPEQFATKTAQHNAERKAKATNHRGKLQR